MAVIGSLEPKPQISTTSIFPPVSLKVPTKPPFPLSSQKPTNY
jgi:hypothetical protein